MPAASASAPEKLQIIMVAAMKQNRATASAHARVGVGARSLASPVGVCAGSAAGISRLSSSTPIGASASRRSAAAGPALSPIAGSASATRVDSSNWTRKTAA